MEKYQGQPICDGIAIGKAFLYFRETGVPKRTQVTDLPAELERLNKAKAMAERQLMSLREKALLELGKEQAQVFESHAMILNDAEYFRSIADLVRTESVNAEYAVMQASNEYAAFFDSMGDPFLAERGADVADVSDRLIACLRSENASCVIPSILSHKDPSSGKCILCADDLSPSEALSIEPGQVAAILLAHGSSTSHAAILAKSKGIPAILGLGPEFLTLLRKHAENEEGNAPLLIVDGKAAEVFLDPSEEMLSAYQEKQKAQEEKLRSLQALKSKESITADGTKVLIFANAGTIEEVKAAASTGADGIGLFRSEFLFFQRKALPTEEEQFQAYRAALECMNGRQVIIRTLDVGADKQLPYLELEKENNPALGLRAIRLCLTRPALFRAQLRALYRASHYGNLSILFPMITSAREVRQILSLCSEVRAELQAEGVPHNAQVPLGIMIETPAAALLSDELAPLVDFFSVGTNDLTQYTLAMDRQSANLEPFRDPSQEAILRLIRIAADNARKQGIPVGVCGELAADPSFTKTFLQMGIRELSVASPRILQLREAVQGVDLRG